MKLKILSAALVLSLCASSLPDVHAGQEVPLSQEVSAEESVSSQADGEDSTIPTPMQVYEAMIALRDQDAYKEGTTWTNYEPYSGTGYYWNGGLIDGQRISAVGCVAFAFILSDTAFGSLPNRMYAPGGFAYEDIKVGDILRVSNDTHTVIVLEVGEAGVVVAEGNYNGTVHWGRTISKEEVMSNTSHYITRYPEGYIPPDDPTANDIIGSGELAAGLTWSLTKAGTLTVSGKGAMPDFSSIGEQPWSDKSDKIRSVVIEEGVTSVGNCAFRQCGVLSVRIPESVTTIGNSAFRGSSIISVDIPAGVKTIGDDAFQGCQNLSSVTLSDGLESIGERAFQSCASLTSIALPASISEVGAAAFQQCTAMTSASFAPGSKQVKLGDNLFTQCYYLMSVTLPQSIDRIGDGMFQNCLMLPGVEIPQGAESIGTWAFASSIVSVVIIPDSVTSIGSAAFSSTPLKDIYFAGTETQWNSISKIGDTAAAVAKATIHYNYSPALTPTPAPEETEVPDVTPDPGETTAPDTTQEPDETAAPDVTPEPDVTTKPDTTPEPEATREPDATTVPDTTPEPGATTTPDATPEPDETVAPDVTPEPDATATPDVTSEPGGTTAPDETTSPDTTPVPDTTASPDVTPAPDETTTPDVTPIPTPEPDATEAPESTPQPDVTPVPNPTPAPVPTQAPVVPTPIPVPTPDTKIPFIKGESGKEGWEAVKKDAADAFDGKWVNVNMNGTSVVPGNVLDSIKGQNVTIAFDMGNGIIWFVNGKNVTAEHANDVDFSVEIGASSIPQNIVSSVAGNRQTTQLALAYNGYFGYSAVLMINLGSANAGLYANLFQYNENTGMLDFITVDQINEDGIAELVFSHASDYVIVVGEDVMGGNSNGTSSGSNGGSASANGGSIQGTGVRSPKTGELDIVIGGADAAELQHERNSLNLMWLFLIGAAVMSVMGTITFLIYKKVNK